jgi:hypothetical protein
MGGVLRLFREEPGDDAVAKRGCGGDERCAACYGLVRCMFQNLLHLRRQEWTEEDEGGEGIEAAEAEAGVDRAVGGVEEHGLSEDVVGTAEDVVATSVAGEGPALTAGLAAVGEPVALFGKPRLREPYASVAAEGRFFAERTGHGAPRENKVNA